MKSSALVKLITSMVIFGTIGIAVVKLPMPRGFIAMVRGAVGALSLLAITYLSRGRLSFRAIWRNLPYLLFSGAFIGVNWILLFESYSYTTVSVATLAYYMAPVFTMLISAVALGERLRVVSLISIAVALVGMLLVSGVLSGGLGGDALAGILLALGAALFYAMATVLNKKMRDIPSRDTSIVQLTAAFLTILPYTLIAEDVSAIEPTPQSIVLLLVVGILHTGVAYSLFFSSVKELPGQTVAIFSYVDPVVSVLLSITLLGEKPTPSLIIGAALIIGALIFAELPLQPRRASKGKD